MARHALQGGLTSLAAVKLADLLNSICDVFVPEVGR